MLPKYTYKATVVKVYDGDTITVDVDLGFGVWLTNQKMRLFGIDTPEVRGKEREEGLIVRDWLRGRILHREIVIKTHKDRKGKYGRWLAEVWFDGVSINNEMLETRRACKY